MVLFPTVTPSIFYGQRETTPVLKVKLKHILRENVILKDQSLLVQI